MARPILAWNNPGHMTIAKLAWDRLDAKQRTSLYELLKHHPHWERFFKASAPPTGVSEVDYAFALAGAWPDWLRGFAKAKDEEGKKIYRFHKGPRHYINWPLFKPGDEKRFEGKLPGPDLKENIVKGIATALDELAAVDKYSPKYRAVSLCWLMHLVGDIHQPLHNSTLFCVAAPKGDLGGNLFWVKSQGQPIRLHAFWDDLLGKEDSYTKGYDRAAANCARLTRADYGREKFAEELKRTDASAWSKEGFALARDIGYAKGELPGHLIVGATYGNEPAEEKAKAPALPASYYDGAEQLAFRQAALASYRLAHLLQHVAR